MSQKRTSALTQNEKNMLIAYHNSNMTIISIAGKMGLGRNTVSRWISRYKKQGNLGLN